jgi:hypothetical protein
LTHLINETMGNNQCRIAMVSHVLSDLKYSSETLQLLQLTSKILKSTRKPKSITNEVCYYKIYLKLNLKKKTLETNIEIKIK